MNCDSIPFLAGRKQQARTKRNGSMTIMARIPHVALAQHGATAAPACRGP
ncbi:hypothetical protein CSE45_1729 [Citreicella sp. SE45]|nr:hypothetical protein CSE45_1729 [Citreicella sp. SE45]